MRMSKTEKLKELFDEVLIITNYRENRKDRWIWTERKYSKARLKRLRLTIDEILRGIENDR